MSKTLDCGCIIYSAGSFKFCPLHDAAPDLLAALEDIGKHNARGALAEESEWLAFLPKQSRDAIAKAERD